MHWPQITWIVLAALYVGVFAAVHGQPRNGKHSITPAVFQTTVTAILLYFGGFFSQ